MATGWGENPGRNTMLAAAVTLGTQDAVCGVVQGLTGRCPWQHRGCHKRSAEEEVHT